MPAAPNVVGAYLASLAGTHAPATIRRRLAALGKMHRYNDLPWNAAHGAIQGPLQGLLRRHGRPPAKAAALSLAMLRQLLATCDRTARGRRDRALLLFGFTGALRRSELVALHVEDVRIDAHGLRLRIRRGKTDPEKGGGEESRLLPRGKHAETCPLPFQAFEAPGGRWRGRNAGPLFPQYQHARADRRGGAAPGRGAADPSASHPPRRVGPGGVRPAERARTAGRLHHRSVCQGRARR